MFEPVDFMAKEVIETELGLFAQAATQELSLGRPEPNQNHHLPGVRKWPLDWATTERSGNLHQVNSIDLAGQVGWNLLQFVETPGSPRPDPLACTNKQRPERLPPFRAGGIVPFEYPAERFDEWADNR
jgi:hypothetical protein